jgi:O-phosphoseryl-tRNA(Cys) synthetase
LINVLFSDALAGDFVSIGDVANRQMLDTGKAGNDELFGRKCRRRLSNLEIWPTIACNSVDDEVFCDKEGQINPALIVNHNWKKLRTIWKSLNSDYKAALTRFTVSGTHDSNFFSFCNGKLETYYLRFCIWKKTRACWNG